jgi:hypothetical protein
MLHGVNVLFSIPDLSKSLIGFEFGASRDMERLKVVVENMNTLMPRVHG